MKKIRIAILALFFFGLTSTAWAQETPQKEPQKKETKKHKDSKKSKKMNKHVCTETCHAKGKHLYKHGEEGHICDANCKMK